MPLKKSANAARDYEALRASRKLAADENKWLRPSKTRGKKQ